MSSEVTVIVPAGYVGRRTFRLLDEAGVPVNLTATRIDMVVARRDGYVVFRRELQNVGGNGNDGYCTYTFVAEDWTDLPLESDPYAKCLSTVVGTEYLFHFVQVDLQTNATIWTYPQDRPAVLQIGQLLRT